MTTSTDEPGLGYTQELALDKLLDEFERAWGRGESLAWDALLPADEHARRRVLVELAKLELALHREGGEPVPAEAWLKQYPALADDATFRQLLSESGQLTRSERDSAPTSFGQASTTQHATSAAPAPVSADVFRQELIASGLCSAAELQSWLCALPADPPPQDGQQLADELVRQSKLTPYQAEQVLLGRGQSLVLGNYVLLDKLGQGGMGLVCRAEHRRMRRSVALKVLAPHLTQTPESLRRFRREVEAAAKLSHPNIVIAHDADEAHGTHFLVMEYVEGLDLAAYVRQHGPLPPDLAVNCILQAARGLQYAHEQGVVHRDIKPNNLLLDSRGTVKVLDLGLARLVSAGPQQDLLTGTGQIMGTVDYMAPEQARDTRHADQRADIYGLGATLFYLLTARGMYPGETIVQKLLAHQMQSIPALDVVCPGVPAELSAVFSKMVAKRPDDRYQTMAEVLAALEPCLGTERGSLGAVRGSPEPALGPTDRSPLSRRPAFDRFGEVGRPAPSAGATAGGCASAASVAGQAVVEEGCTAASDRKSPLGGTRLETDPPASPSPSALRGRGTVTKPTRTVATRFAAFRARRFGIALLALGLSGLGLFGIILISTPDGQLVIESEVEDVDVVVSQQGRQVKVIDLQTGSQVTLKSGDYSLALRDDRNDVQLSKERITLKRGDTEIVKIIRAKVPPATGNPERDVAGLVQRLSGLVTVEQQDRVLTIEPTQPLPAEPFHIVGVLLPGGGSKKRETSTVDGLRRLSTLPKLRTLCVEQCRLGAEGLSAIAKIATLEELRLATDGTITDASLSALVELAKLKQLELFEVPVGDSGLEQIGRLVHLRRLRVQRASVTDAGIHTSGR